jgi:predicted lipoprotein with Yx(FWY)xxD motif
MNTDGQRTQRKRRPTRALRWSAIGAAAMVSSFSLAVPTSASAATNASRVTVVKVKTTSGPLGTVLVDGMGRTLYVDSRDRANQASCTGSCSKVWPPLLLPKGVKRAVAGVGVKDLGTVRRSGHRLQVTSHKMPLYLYVGDLHPGQGHGQGKNAMFFVATPNGAPHSVPTTPPSTPAPSGTPAPQVATTAPSQATTPPPSGSSSVNTAPPTVPAPTMPPPPPTRPPVTSPLATNPPPTTAPAGGGVAY